MKSRSNGRTHRFRRFRRLCTGGEGRLVGRRLRRLRKFVKLGSCSFKGSIAYEKLGINKMNSERPVQNARLFSSVDDMNEKKIKFSI